MKKFWNWKSRKIRDQASGEETEERVLFLNGTIAEESWFDDDVTPALFKDELHAGGGDITVWINSPGGDCVAAAQIYNMLSEYPGKVTVKVDGIAASAASVIAMAGNDVRMSPVSTMMIHNPATIAWGDHTEMQKAMDLLDAVKESIINAYVLKTGLSRAKLSHLMDAETWMDANKALELGFADGILFTNVDSGETEDEKRAVSVNSVMFSRKAVNNALVNKLERHFGKLKKTAEEQAAIGSENSAKGTAGPVNVGTGAERKIPADGKGGEDNPCHGCFGAAADDCKGCGKGNANDTGNGRSAEELRERLNVIKKFI